MKDRNTEKKIYELLGVNIFRKYVLGTWEKLWKLFRIDKLLCYKITDMSENGLKNYKIQSKGFAAAHIGLLVYVIINGILITPSMKWWVFNLGLNIYCIMTQRYTHIRINEILEKKEELKQRREERENSSEIENILTLDKTKKFVPSIEQPLSIEAQRKELKNLKKFLVSINPIDTQEQIINSEEKGQVKALKPANTNY